MKARPGAWRAAGVVSVLGFGSWLLLGTPMTAEAAANRIEQVFVTNDATAPIPVAPQGVTPVNGTIGIDPTQNTVQVTGVPDPPAPYQALVVVPGSTNTVTCGAIPLPPDGELVRISAIRVAALSNEPSAGSQMRAFLRSLGVPSVETFDIPVFSPTPTPEQFRYGSIETDLYHGTVVAPDNRGFNYGVCVGAPIGSLVEFKIHVTGVIVSAT